jgi:hypothetical protein
MHSVLNGLSLPDQTPQLYLGDSDLVTVTIPLTQQIVTGFSMSSLSGLYLSELAPQIVFNMVGANLRFKFDYKLRSEPDWLHDNGTGSIVITGMNATFLMTPKIVNGALEMDFKPAGNISMADYQFSITGQTDISKTFGRFMAKFQDFFKTEVTSLLAQAMSESFDDAFLELLNPTVQDEAGNVIVSEITDPVYAVPGTNQ